MSIEQTRHEKMIIVNSHEHGQFRIGFADLKACVAAKMSDVETGAKYNIPHGIVRTMRRKAGLRGGRKNYWSSKQISLFTRMREDGASVEDCAKRTNHTVHGCRDLVRRLKDKARAAAKKAKKTQAETETHICARCRKPFERTSKFITRCDRCKTRRD